ncbi:MAG TPA: hypothetical protein VEG60_06400, partial [Candidatus Binatia bacterium]|nr:hypothetical protein [Candidatus Binatia bacterium]
MSAWKRFGLGAVLFAGAVFVLAYLSLFFVVRSDRFQQWLKTEALSRTGHKIDLSDLRLIFPFRLVASALKISNEFGTVVEAERIVVALSFTDLFFKSIHRIELQKPIFYMDLDKLLGSPEASSVGIGVRHLNIHDGKIVLKTAGGRNLDFHAVNLSAQNLNLGQSAGIVLQTDIPWLEGSAEIAIRGERNQMAAEIKLRQAPFPKATQPSPQTPATESLIVKAQLRTMASQALEIRMSGMMTKLIIGEAKISGQFDLQADVEPSFKQAAVSGRVQIKELPAQIGSVQLVALTGETIGTLSGHYLLAEALLKLTSIHLDSPAGTVDGQGMISFKHEPTVTNTQAKLRKIPAALIQPFLPEPIDRWSLRGSAEADLKLDGTWHALAINGVARMNGAELKSATFSLQQLNFVAPFQWVNSSLSAENIRAQGKFLTAANEALQLAADELELVGALELKANEPVKASARFRLMRGRYATSDGSKMGENLAFGGRIEIIDREKRLLSVSGKLDFEQGEILWGKFFGDLQPEKPSLDFDGDYLPGNDELQLRKLSFSVAAVGTVGLKGTVKQISLKPTVRLQAQGSDIRPSGVFQLFIREMLHRSYPILDQLAVGGRVDFAARLSGALDDLFVEGNLHVRRGSLQAKSNQWQVGPVNLALPFRFHLPAATHQETSATVSEGMLAIESFRFGSESVPAFKTPVSLSNNALKFKQPIRVPIYGGTIEIRDLTWNDLLKDPQVFSLSIEAQNLQLQRITASLGWYRFGGTVSASIPKVEMTGNILRSEGQIQIQVFGGDVRVSNTEVENPFSSLPAIKLDARFEGIHLEQASETFAFGRISGILEGTLTDLIIINGQPAQLRADVHTVEQPGSSQWISVEALNKITILSSGEDGSLVYGGIASLFDEFRYSKMGFKAALRNDKLTLRGIESSDGKEFLVVGSLLPPTVNVIS